MSAPDPRATMSIPTYEIDSDEFARADENTRQTLMRELLSGVEPRSQIDKYISDVAERYSALDDRNLDYDMIARLFAGGEEQWSVSVVSAFIRLHTSVVRALQLNLYRVGAVLQSDLIGYINEQTLAVSLDFATRVANRLAQYVGLPVTDELVDRIEIIPQVLVSEPELHFYTAVYRIAAPK